MSAAKFTEGPWISATTGPMMENGYSQPFGIGSSDGTQLIAGAFGDVRGGREQAEANARLIACTPDLLALARMVVEEYGPNGGDWQSVVRSARAAIAAATGETANTDQGNLTALPDCDATWQPIESAPTEFPPLKCLLTGPGLGTHIGTVLRYEDGVVLANVPHVAGNVADMTTHWMPLPKAPA